MVLDGGKIRVDLNDTASVVSGTPLNDLYQSLFTTQEKIRKELSLIPYSSGFNRNAANEEKRATLLGKLYWTGFEHVKENRHNAIGRRLYREGVTLCVYHWVRNVDYLDLYNLGDDEMKGDPEVEEAINHRRKIEEKERLASELRQQNADQVVIDSVLGIGRITIVGGATGTYKDFTFCSVAGDSVSLSQLVGKSDYLLVEIWASWCRPCKALIPFLKELWEEYDRETLNIISVSIDDTHEVWLNELEKQKMPWDQYVITNEFAQEKLRELYEFRGIPHTIVITREGDLDKSWYYDKMFSRGKR